MEPGRFEIATERLTLRPWQRSDSAEFAAMNADPEVMADLGGPLSAEDSDRKLERFTRSFEQNGITRWVVESGSGRFLGYCGVVTKTADDHPLGPHHDVGWRLTRQAWGHGYASEAATAALDDAFGRAGLSEIFAYTAPDNVRSQNVMIRLGLRRAPDLDFSTHYDDVGLWNGLVWVAENGTSVATYG